MMKLKRAMAIVTMMVVGAVAFAGSVAVSPTDVELVDGYTVSYEVAPSDAVLTYLESQGVDTGLLATHNTNAFNEQLANLLRIEPVDENEDGIIQASESIKQTLVDKVNSALIGAATGENVVFMDLGNFRWVLAPSTYEYEDA